VLKRTLLLACVVMPSFGAIIPILGAIAPHDDAFTFFYAVSLAAQSKLDAVQTEAQVVVLYDFADYTPGSAGSISGNWMVTTVPTGPLGPVEFDPNATYSTFPAATDVNDNPAIPNLVFTYVGPLILGPQNDFDVVFADSTQSDVTLRRFRGQGTKVFPPPLVTEHNTALGTNGAVTVPFSETFRADDIPSVPEPGSLAMLGGGLTSLALLHRKR
jgi:hypothetical protein